jgi:metal-dependent amidase/aminoacylase/carboxypeptidase family protein
MKHVLILCVAVCLVPLSGLAMDAETVNRINTASDELYPSLVEARRASCDVEYHRSTPAVFNDPELAASSVAILRESLGDDAVFEASPIMAAEDFAEYAQVVPGFFFFLGVGNTEKGWTSYVHTPTFQPDEEALRFGVRAASTLLLGTLQGD